MVILTTGRRGNTARFSARAGAARPRSGRARTSQRSGGARSESRRVFLRSSTQHVKRSSSVGDWLAGGAMLLGMATWGVLVSLLGA